MRPREQRLKLYEQIGNLEEALRRNIEAMLDWARHNNFQLPDFIGGGRSPWEAYREACGLLGLSFDMEIESIDIDWDQEKIDSMRAKKAE